VLCRGDRAGFRRASRADPQGRILTGGADKAERRRAPGAVRPLGRQAPQCPAVTAAKENDPVASRDHRHCAGASESRGQSAAAFSVAANLVVITRVDVCRVWRVRGVSQRSAYRACDCTAWKVRRWRLTPACGKDGCRVHKSPSHGCMGFTKRRKPSATGHSPRSPHETIG
jgi:hypothetical protein